MEQQDLPARNLLSSLSTNMSITAPQPLAVTNIPVPQRKMNLSRTHPKAVASYEVEKKSSLAPTSDQQSPESWDCHMYATLQSSLYILTWGSQLYNYTAHKLVVEPCHVHSIAAINHPSLKEMQDPCPSTLLWRWSQNFSSLKIRNLLLISFTGLQESAPLVTDCPAFIWSLPAPSASLSFASVPWPASLAYLFFPAPSMQNTCRGCTESTKESGCFSWSSWQSCSVLPSLNWSMLSGPAGGWNVWDSADSLSDQH